MNLACLLLPFFQEVVFNSFIYFFKLIVFDLDANTFNLQPGAQAPTLRMTQMGTRVV